MYVQIYLIGDTGAYEMYAKNEKGDAFSAPMKQLPELTWDTIGLAQHSCANMLKSNGWIGLWDWREFGTWVK